MVPVLLIVAWFCLWAGALPARQDLPRRQVAVTFDDLPGVSVRPSVRCNADAIREMNRKLVNAITDERVPALGLVVESRACRGAGILAELLGLWLDAGLDLGNHSFSHFDLNHTPVARYQADIVRGESVTKKLLQTRGRTLRYFHHPFLHAGADIATRREVEAFLAKRRYTIAPVTIDNQEWVFAEVYVRLLDRGDRAAAERVAGAYVRYMDEVFDFFEKRSVEVLGYEVRQVLLLHANQLNADYFRPLAAMMRKRGYAFVPMDEALKDPAYRLADSYAGRDGISWIHRWAVTKGLPERREPREPAFIAKLYSDMIR